MISHAALAEQDRLIHIINANPGQTAHKIAQEFYGTKKPIGGQVFSVKRMMSKLKPFLSKSAFTREMELSEAYVLNLKMRINLKEILEKDIMLIPNERLRITKQIHKLNLWIYETEQSLIVQFEEV